MYGKIKENREQGQKFSEWVAELFPGLGISNDVPAAIWFATEFRTPYEKLPHGLTHPKHIRAWFNEQEVVAAPALDLTLTAPDRLTASVEQVGKVAKKHPHTLFA